MGSINFFSFGQFKYSTNFLKLFISEFDPCHVYCDVVSYLTVSFPNLDCFKIENEVVNFLDTNTAKQILYERSLQCLL